jgi:predicted nucleic acid-binding protein
VSFLVDTNVISELRKGSRCDRAVISWFETLQPDEIFLSVLNLGELRRGIELIRRRDQVAAYALEEWLESLVEYHGERILPVDREVAAQWGKLTVPDPLPVVDALLAATAKVHRLTLATRNTKDVERTGVRCVNPFKPVR